MKFDANPESRIPALSDNTDVEIPHPRTMPNRDDHARYAQNRAHEQRRRIAVEAARLIAEGGLRDYRQAKLKAASRLGITPQGRVYGNTPVGFAVDAVQLALADAGLERNDLDGLLLNPGLAWGEAAMGSFMLQQALGERL